MRQFRTADNSLNLQLLDNVLQYKGEVILGIYNYPCQPLPIFSALARNALYEVLGIWYLGSFPGLLDDEVVAGDYMMPEDKQTLL
jgi:hypothetical protein